MMERQMEAENHQRNIFRSKSADMQEADQLKKVKKETEEI